MAYVAPEQTEPGTRLEIDVRGTPRTAIVKDKPIYHPNKEA
jgi:glycine cleavage system aminomethyltransferase T